MAESLFLRTMGDSPTNRVLDFLIVHQEFDHSMTDIARSSGVGYSTLKLFWNSLESNKMIINTRTVGKAKMYQLNTSNPAVSDFVRFYWTLTKKAVHESIRERILAE